MSVSLNWCYEVKTVSWINSALNACFYSSVDKALIYNIELSCSVDGTGIETRVCGCRTERKTDFFFFLNTGTLAVLGMECRAPSSTKFGQRKLLPFLIKNSHSHCCFFFPLPYSSHPISFLSFFFPFSLYVACPPSSFFSFHSSQMSLQFNLLYCCNKVIHLFGQSLVNCRQMNICCTIFFTSSDQWLCFISFMKPAKSVWPESRQ